MANQKISERVVKGALTGSEKIPVGEATDPAVTPDQIAALAVTSIRAGVASAGDTLAKLYALILALGNLSDTDIDTISELNAILTDADLMTQTAINSALALKLDKNITPNRQSASYTLLLADASKMVEMNNASANNLTVPPNSSVAFDVGTQILLSQYGAGQTTIVAGSGVTLRSKSGFLKIGGQYAGATLVKIATDEWYVFGDLIA